MPQITEEQFRQHRQYFSTAENDRSQWLKLWRELSDNYLPQRYRWLMPSKEYYANRARRQYIINNTGTRAARVLQAGMMNGITSPSRPWFKLRVAGLSASAIPHGLAVWLEEVERRMLRVMAESNFYNSMAVMYLDMAVFGSAANLIYEDRESIIRCYNPPLGEYYFIQSDRMQVNGFIRKLNLKVYQYVQRWPDRRLWSERVKLAVERGGAALAQDVEISHFIGPNMQGIMPRRFQYYELYWETRRQYKAAGGAVDVLEKRGFNELPGMFARWELSGNDAYGVSPAMDALGDNIELQHLHRNKAKLLEKQHNPPLLADIILQNDPLSNLPGGVTFVGNLGTQVGAKPIYTVDPRFDQLNLDQQSIERRIQDTFYNYLFTGITDLQTTRSATEIEARESEKLILLGGVLERFESEALDPGIKRIYSICDRAGLFPPLPEQFSELDLEVQYVSILAIAQRAVGTAPTERLWQVTGNLAEVQPGLMDIPDWDTSYRNYARDIGIRESELKPQEVVDQLRKQRADQQQAAQMAEMAPQVAGAANQLSQTDVGGGGNALQLLLGR